jgi:hypothetical protein
LWTSFAFAIAAHDVVVPKSMPSRVTAFTYRPSKCD